MSEIHLAELGRSLRESLTLSDERTTRFIDALISVMRSALQSGKEVALPGMGTITLASKDGKVLPALYPANLVGEISAKIQERNEAGVRSMLEGLVGALKRELLEGRKVILDDIGTFELRRDPPQIERQPRGHRLIRPAMAALSFHSTRTVTTPVGEGRLIFQVADDLRRKVEQNRESTILLVAAERDFFVKTLEYYFDSAGWDIEVQTSIAGALSLLEKSKAYLVVADAGLPDYQKLVRQLKMRRETNAVPLILLYPNESSFQDLQDLTIIGDENLVQPFEFRRLLDGADAEILRSAEEKLIFLHQLHVHVPTEEQFIDRTIEEVQSLLEQSGLAEDGQVAMSAAFREAMLNAAQHGNKFKKDRKIEVQYLLDRDKLTLVVKDNGPGFNHELYVRSGQSGSAIAAARDRHAQGRMGGLGILLMLRCCDQLEYNQKGNQVTMTKFLKPQT